MKSNAIVLSGTLIGGVLLLGCNVNLSGANLTANVDAKVDANISNSGNNNGGNNIGTGDQTGGTIGGGQTGTGGLQGVTAIRIEANTDTMVLGALLPWESDKRYDYQPPTNNGGPTLFPTPQPVGSPYPMPTLAALVELFATVGGNNQIRVGQDDPNFAFMFDRGGIQIDRRDGKIWLYPNQGAPAGDVTFKVSYQGDKVVAKKTFHVLSGGQVAVEAE